MARPKIRTISMRVDMTPVMKDRIAQAAQKVEMSQADIVRHAIERYTTPILGESIYLGNY